LLRLVKLGEFLLEPFELLVIFVNTSYQVRCEFLPGSLVYSAKSLADEVWRGHRPSKLDHGRRRRIRRLLLLLFVILNEEHPQKGFQCLLRELAWLQLLVGRDQVMLHEDPRDEIEIQLCEVLVGEADEENYYPCWVL
jgi:hypothetical protein